MSIEVLLSKLKILFICTDGSKEAVLNLSIKKKKHGLSNIFSLFGKFILLLLYVLNSVLPNSVF